MSENGTFIVYPTTNTSMPRFLEKGVPLYRKEGENYLIEIMLDEIEELFNNFDPAPLRRKDLRPDIEEYIFDGALDCPLNAPLTLVVYLPENELKTIDAPSKAAISSGVHNFFNYCLWKARKQLRMLLRDGRLSLMVGITVLITSIILSHSLQGEHTITKILAEGVAISGWVAMWYPFNVFLYDWWPLKRHVKIYARLRDITVDLRTDNSLPDSNDGAG